MIRVLMDLSYISSEKKATESVAIYSFRFLDSLKDSNEYVVDLLVAEEMEYYFKDKYPQYKQIIYPLNNKLICRLPYVKGVYKMFKWKSFVNSLSYDEIFIPFSWSGNSLKTSIPKTITIHDLRPMRQANRAYTDSVLFKFLRLKNVYLRISRFFYYKHCKNAKIIIGISNFVSNEIEKEWPQYRDKIKTVYNGIPKKEVEVSPVAKLSGLSYMLYVNTLAEYKNVITLVRAFGKIEDEFAQTYLVIVGKSTAYWDNVVIPEIKNLGLERRVVHLEYVSEGELQWLYENATLFVSTSLYEGFGYTPIEASVSGTPVISSRCESLPDVTAEKVYYYDPPLSDVNLSCKIREVLLTPPSKEALMGISNFFKQRYNLSNQTEKIVNLILS